MVQAPKLTRQLSKSIDQRSPRSPEKSQLSKWRKERNREHALYKLDLAWAGQPQTNQTLSRLANNLVICPSSTGSTT